MLDFMNSYFMLCMTYVSLAVEMSGLLHAVYLVQILFSQSTGETVATTELKRSGIQKVFFWARVAFSCITLAFSFVVTLTALFKGQTTMYEGVPDFAAVVILLVLMCFIGMLEGMQISLFAVVNLTDEEIGKHRFAYRSCKLVFSGSNLQAFLIGRQICVTFCMFVIARITTCNVDVDSGDDNIFGVNNVLQELFNTGLFGAIITTIVGSLCWRIIAASFPLTFLSNPFIYLIIRLCLALEASGICSAAWLLALIHKAIAGFRPDEVYIGTPELRAALSKDASDDTDNLEYQDKPSGSTQDTYA